MTVYAKQTIKFGLGLLNCALILFIFASMAHGQSLGAHVRAMRSGINQQPSVWVNLGYANHASIVVCNPNRADCYMPDAGENGVITDVSQSTVYIGKNVGVYWKECDRYALYQVKQTF